MSTTSRSRPLINLIFFYPIVVMLARVESSLLPQGDKEELSKKDIFSIFNFSYSDQGVCYDSLEVYSHCYQYEKVPQDLWQFRPNVHYRFYLRSADDPMNMFLVFDQSEPLWSEYLMEVQVCKGAIDLSGIDCVPTLCTYSEDIKWPKEIKELRFNGPTRDIDLSKVKLGRIMIDTTAKIKISFGEVEMFYLFSKYFVRLIGPEPGWFTFGNKNLTWKKYPAKFKC